MASASGAETCGNNGEMQAEAFCDAVPNAEPLKPAMEGRLAPSNPLVDEVRQLLQTARRTVAQQVNTRLLQTYWEIGRVIVKYEQKDQPRAEYGQQTLKELSRELTREFGKGFSRSNLQNMRLFYLAYQKCQTVSGKFELTWSHYCELLSISDESKRSFYDI